MWRHDVWDSFFCFRESYCFHLQRWWEENTTWLTLQLWRWIQCNSPKRYYTWRMVSSGMLRHAALRRNNVSEELSAFFIRVTRISELVTRLAVTSNRRTQRRNSLVTLMKEGLSSSETSVLTKATRRNIPEDTILHSRRRENLKSYMLVHFLTLCRITL
jgi:hypothetical protein